MKKIIYLICLCICCFLLCACDDRVSKSDINWIAVSHRGTNFIAKTNTLPAIMESHKYLYDSVEIDVRKTKDNYIVLAHGETIKGKVNGEDVELNVAKSTYQELLNVVLAHNEEYGDFHIALLDEVLDYAWEYDMRLVIHCKVTDKSFLRAVAKHVVLHGMSTKVMYSVSKVNTNAKYILAIDENAYFHIAYKDGLKPGKYDSVTKNKDKIAITIDVHDMSENIIKNIKESGYKLYIWNVDESHVYFADSAQPDYIEFISKLDLSKILKED